MIGSVAKVKQDYIINFNSNLSTRRTKWSYQEKWSTVALLTEEMGAEICSHFMILAMAVGSVGILGIETGIWENSLEEEK